MMRAQRHWPALVNSLRLYVYVYILVEFWWKKVGNRRIKSYASWDNLLPIMICFCLYLCRVFWGNKCFHSFIHSFNSRIWNPQTDRYAWHSSLRGASACTPWTALAMRMMVIPSEFTQSRTRYVERKHLSVSRTIRASSTAALVSSARPSPNDVIARKEVTELRNARRRIAKQPERARSKKRTLPECRLQTP